jgi:beta-galactosidase
VKGTVRGLGSKATAIITAYVPVEVEPWSTTVPVGVTPTLPPTARVVFSDGVDQHLPVTWETVPDSAYDTPGVVNVAGTVEGVELDASAVVEVTADFVSGQNLASASGSLNPSADASYSGSNGARPAFLLDGNSATGGWSNFYNKQATALIPAISVAHAEDWVSVGWPAQQSFGELRAYFTISASRGLPASITVSSWDGDSWTPVDGLDVVWATASNTPTVITFDEVSSSAVRVDMTSAAPGTNTGFLQITELEVIGDLLT